MKEDGRIEYDFKKFGSWENNMVEEPDIFCMQTCSKICFYLSKVYDIDMYWMRAEFVRDDDGKIYLFDVQEILAWEFNPKMAPILYPERFKKLLEEDSKIKKLLWKAMLSRLADENKK